MKRQLLECQGYPRKLNVVLWVEQKEEAKCDIDIDQSDVDIIYNV